ncbi:DUF1573 domain-containing protein [Chitinophaga vietnamensis]|uniref:DUF1573 domain-containing protein n=1 Tax=Chitinophaga vietnamensis TaxID=2593957 RepID=UPI00117802AF|nr:DUF1573 domain-containing protein [Chitinophaga vietnamensis]
MKTLFTFLACGSIFLAACNNHSASKAPADSSSMRTVEANTNPGKGPVMTFEEKVHDFGEITQGEKVEYSFKFTNTGSKDLIIEDAISSCGCTVPEWPKAPIKPGQSGFLKVVFDSHGKQGYTQKDISVKINDASGYIIGPKIQCNIIVK